MSDQPQSDLPKIAITGGSGRMGRMLTRHVLERDDCRLSAVLERPGHPWIGQDVGEAAGGPAVGVVVTDDALTAIAGCRALIDFTSPDATVAFGDHAAQARCVHVIGTTGFDEDHLRKLELAARHATQIRAGNMSLGVNLLVQLTRQVARALGEEFDIEVIEAHHNQKVDAPSGTALMLGQAAAEGRGVSLEDKTESGRDGMTGPRKPGAIGFSAIRGGDIVGEHDVLFAGAGERIVLRHVATDRAIFARGAVKAALWGLDRGPGSYDMLDVLGLEG